MPESDGEADDEGEGEDGGESEQDLVERAEEELAEDGDITYGLLSDEDADGEAEEALEASPLKVADDAPKGGKRRQSSKVQRRLPGSQGDPTAGAAAPTAAEAPVATAPAADAAVSKPKKKTKLPTVVPDEPLERLAFIVFDIETTSNQRKQFDRIIEYGFIAYNHRGVELGRCPGRLRNVSPLPDGGRVPISARAFEKHGIADKDLDNEPEFSQLGRARPGAPSREAAPARGPFSRTKSRTLASCRAASSAWRLEPSARAARGSMLLCGEITGA